MLAGGNEVYGNFQKYVETAYCEEGVGRLGADLWAISYPACKFLIKSEKTDAVGTFVEYYGGQVDPLLRIQRNWLETSRRDTHGRRRAISNRAFRSRTFNAHIQESIQRVVGECADQLGKNFSGDLVAAYSQPISDRLTIGWLGIPSSLAHRFMDVMRSIGLTIWVDLNDDSPEIRDVNLALAELLPELADCWRGNKFTSGLGAALHEANDVAADPLSETEAISTLINFGFNISLLQGEISGFVAELLTEARPQAPAILTADADALIWELYRLATPASPLLRQATEDFVYGDTKIAAGQWIALHIAAALRDPRHFSRPGEVDLARKPDMLAFGSGPHTCPGSRPSIDVAKSAIQALWSRFDVVSDGEIDWAEGPCRNVRALPVRMVGRS